MLDDDLHAARGAAGPPDLPSRRPTVRRSCSTWPRRPRWIAEQYPNLGVTERPGGVLRVTLPVTERAWLERLLLRAGRSAAVVEGDDTVGPAAAAEFSPATGSASLFSNVRASCPIRQPATRPGHQLRHVLSLRDRVRRAGPSDASGPPPVPPSAPPPAEPPKVARGGGSGRAGHRRVGHHSRRRPHGGDRRQDLPHPGLLHPLRFDGADAQARGPGAGQQAQLQPAQHPPRRHRGVQAAPQRGRRPHHQGPHQAGHRAPWRPDRGPRRRWSTSTANC